MLEVVADEVLGHFFVLPQFRRSVKLLLAGVGMLGLAYTYLLAGVATGELGDHQALHVDVPRCDAAVDTGADR